MCRDLDALDRDVFASWLCVAVHAAVTIAALDQPLRPGEVGGQ